MFARTYSCPNVQPNSLSKRKRRRVWWRAWTTATTPGRPMSGLHRLGVDVNPFGSKYQERFGGHAAGQGQRTAMALES